MVHEEGNLIKRSIRDLYTKEIEEVVVSGDDGYRMAKDFMKLLIPSHAKRVQPYKDEGVSLTQRYQVEDQLSAIHSPEVHMRSGGYIVINPTEALVSIDVNSGKATKERNIEETAYKTNMEAAEEIARQLKLRDLAGLIVIDFIDMEASRNQTRVERQLKDAMRNDRARIQIGRISPFGLLELSRQRLRPSLLETSSESCPHCEGTGVRRSTDSTALHILRMLEDECTRRKADELTLFVPTSVALYLLNYKRKALADVETRYETTIIVENDDTLIPPDCRIERNGDVKVIEQPKLAPINNRPNKNLNAEEDAEDEETDDGSKRRKRRRGRRRKRSDNDNAEVIETTDTTVAQNESSGTESSEEAASKDVEEGQDTRRRRGRRGGRNRGRKPEDNAQTETEETAEVAVAAAASNDAVLVDDAAIPAVKVTDITEEDVVEAPKPRRRRRRKTTEGAQEGTADVQVIPITVAEAEVHEASAEEAPEAEVEATPEVKEEESPKKTARKPRRKVAPKKAKEETESAGTAPAETASTEAESVEEVAEAPKPKRRRRAKAVVKEVATAEAPVITTEVKTPTPEPVAKEPVPEVEEKLAKKGWWRR